MEAAGPPQPSIAASGDRCPSCGAIVAADQRYCLECGQRRGDPRLPFMDAVFLLEAIRRPRAENVPTPSRRSRISPNAALITGVGTLLLALGVGVLIGQNGQPDATPTAAAPQIIKVGGDEGAGEAKTATTGGGNAAKAKTKKQKEAALEAAEKHPAAEEVLKPAADVKLPPPTVQPGDKCEPGAAGCEGGEFTGEFFE